MLIMRDKIFSISQKRICNMRILKVLYTRFQTEIMQN